MQRTLSSPWPLALLLLAMGLAACRQQEQASTPTPVQPPAPVSYTHLVRPILAQKCFPCHGIDDRRNESGLRLDEAELAQAVLSSGGHALVPGNAAASVAWQRINETDPELRMPPADSGLTLTDSERKTIARWIEQGAEYEPHWAYQPLPASVPVPATSSPWPRNEIDHFILARLGKDGLTPAAPAAPATLLRRLTLDLTGLPPATEALTTIEEDALDEAVEALLESPAFGETLATLWLDSIHYADLYNRETTELNPQWPYRDWVVNAFRDNLPFDRFLVSQLAGDLLDDPSRDDLLATAYHRLLPLEQPAPGRSADAARKRLATGRVDTLGRAILGIRLECIRCHDHKIDHLSLTDYYALTAFFDDVPETGFYHAADSTPPPALPLPTPTQEAALARAKTELTRVTGEFANHRAQAATTFEAWRAEKLATPLIDDLVALFTFDEREPGVTNHALGGTATATTGELPFLDDGFRGAAITCNGERAVLVEDLFPVDRSHPWSFSLWVRDQRAAPEPVVLLSRGTPARGLDLRLAGGHLSARLFRAWPTHALAVRTPAPAVPQGQWTMVSWTYDGSGQAGGMRLYVDGQPVPVTVEVNHLRRPAVEADPTIRLGGTPGGAGFRDGALDDVHIHRRALTPLEIAHLYDGQSLTEAKAAPAAHLDDLRDYYESSIDPALRQTRSDLAAARQQAAGIAEGIHEVSVMGVAEAPTAGAGGSTTRAVPNLLPPLPTANARPTRLDLAHWLTHPDHPLTARVFVNRLWAHFFGRGLVSTVDGFDLAGPAPSHPDLLDWLARDFVASGWDIKHLCRQVVTSATYRQSPAGDSTALAGDDQTTTLLAGFPSSPLTPDTLHDLALAASGLLAQTAGGPPVPRGHLSTHRALYTIRPHAPLRPAMPPAPAGEPPTCMVDHRAAPPKPTRPIEGTLVRAARELAGLTLDDSEDDNLRLRFLFLRTTGRPPSDSETSEWLGVLAEERNRFSGTGASAPRLIQGGDSEGTSSRDSGDLGPWTALVSRLLESAPVRRKE